jgi:hypothetical protein
MNGKRLEELFAAHFRGERAIAAARPMASPPMPQCWNDRTAISPTVQPGGRRDSAPGASHDLTE